jgi:UPF0716 protein FxsA
LPGHAKVSPAMLFYLFLLFTVVPIIELALLIWLGGQTVWWLPVLLVIADGIAGALLWRWQGLRTLARVREEMAAKRMPADAMVDGLLIFFAGGLLISPGMLTDFAGFALLIPPIRRVVKQYLKAWFLRHMEVRTAGMYGGAKSPGDSRDGDEIIDAKVLGTRVEDVR